MATICFLLSVIIPVGILFLVFYRVFPLVATGGQTFDDFIIENVSSSGYDKSGELTMFWALTVAGILMSLLLVYLFSKLHKSNQSRTSSGPCAALGQWYAKNGSTGKAFLLNLMLSYYLIMAGLTVLVHISPKFILSQNIIYVLAILLAFANFFIHRFAKISLQKLILCMQLAIPGLLSLYFVDTYLYRGQVLRVPYAGFYYLFFGGLILLFEAFLVIHLKKYGKSPRNVSLGKLIHPVTAITVFIYNSWSACPMYAQPDQHHHGEQLIPWQQIVSLGQTAYEEYTPVSGLFPMVNGFIQNVLLGGTVSDYSPAISMMMVLFCILTMYLICKHVGGAYGLLFAVFFALPSYNRQYMVLPVLLLLFSRDLVKKPSLWLKFWIFSCFLAGLYYPLYGAAVLLGTLPAGIYMLLRFLRETNLKVTLRKPGFYAGWLLVLLPVFVSIPLLLRMVEHTLTYSGQTVLADGISLFGQSAPDYFLSFLAGSHEYLRLWLYYGLRFFLPSSALILALALATFILLKNKEKKTEEKTLLLLGLLAVTFTLTISYTYTLVRADYNMILSRTAPVLLAVTGMFLPVLLIGCGRKLVPESLRFLLIMGCFSLPLLIYPKVSAMKFPDMWVYPNGEARLLFHDEAKLFSAYEVPENFISMSEVPLSDTSMLGNGFMVADQVHYLTDYASVMEKVRPHKADASYMGMDGQGFYYYLNAKCCATGYIQAGKGYAAQQRILENIKKERPVIFLLEPQSSYYIYRYVLLEDYSYCAGDNAFYPKELFEKVYPGESGDDYRLLCGPTDLGLSPTSFGKSEETLLPLLSHMLEISPEEECITLSGAEHDILMLSLPEEIVTQTDSVTVTFTSDGGTYDGASLSCLTGDNTLLIPMGMNPCWLLGAENSNILLNFRDTDGNPVLTLPIEQASAQGILARFYHLDGH